MPPLSRTALGSALGVALLALVTAPLGGSEQRFGGSGPRSAAGAATVLPAASQAQGQPPQTAQPAPQQRGGGPGRDLFFTEWWRDDAIRKELVLSPRQVGRITSIYEERARQMKPVDEEYQKQLAELERLTRERTVEANVYAIQVNRVEALRTELFKSRTLMLYSIYRVLTPEQYQKLREIRDRRRSGRGAGPR